MTPTLLRHGRIRLALHQLPGGDGDATLLVLHGLGVSAPDGLPAGVTWPGPVRALDFTGHGDSDPAPGGGYMAEHLMADADVALAETGPATVLGFGLGAWVALLIAGARPELVRGAVLADGPGFVGGGVEPGTNQVLRPRRTPGPPDDYAVSELSHDLRPADYATFFASLAVQSGPVQPALTVAARQQAPWIDAVASVPGVKRAPVDEALRRYSA